MGNQSIHNPFISDDHLISTATGNHVVQSSGTTVSTSDLITGARNEGHTASVDWRAETSTPSDTLTGTSQAESSSSSSTSALGDHLSDGSLNPSGSIPAGEHAGWPQTQISAGDMGGAPSGTLLHHTRHFVGLGMFTNYWVYSSGRLQMGDNQDNFHHNNWNRRDAPGGYSYHIPIEIIGNSLDNAIYGHGALVINGSAVYWHNDRIDGGAGNDTIYGYSGHDLLRGGEGNDQLFGGAHNDILEGGHGHDLLNGGADQDNLDGGDGNDRLLSGLGSDTLNGGAGDDWLIIDQMGASDQNQLTGGGGFDTFVLSPLVAPELAFEPGGDSMPFSQSVSLNGLGRMSLSALARGAHALSAGLAIGQGLLGLLTPEGSTPPSASLDWSQAQIITDFNPYEDSLILQLHPDNDKVRLEPKQFSGGGGGFYVTQEINGAPAYLADVTFDMAAMQEHASRNGQGHLSTRDLAELAFNTLLRSYVLADGSSSELAVQEGEQTVGLEGLKQLGDNTMIILGAHGATAVSKGVNGASAFSGTALDDILEGHHATTANHPDFSRAVLYGMGGDDILLGGGGSNILHGGEGIDTAFYGYATNSATQGITVDMATMVDGAVLLSNGIREVGKPNVSKGADLDYLYSIENIVGSDRDDIIRGDKGDNLLASGQGNDTLAGRGGRDTFLLSGGTNTIEDFVGGKDRIQIAMQAYAGLSSSADLRFTFCSTDGLTISSATGARIAVLKNVDPTLDPSAFQAKRDVELIDAEGRTHAVKGAVDVITGEPLAPLNARRAFSEPTVHSISGPIDPMIGMEVSGSVSHLMAMDATPERFVSSNAWSSDLSIPVDGFQASEHMLVPTISAHQAILPGITDHSFAIPGVLSTDLSHGLVLG